MPAHVAVDLSTSQRHEMIDITARVKNAVRASGVESGICVVYVPHTTAGVCVNENTNPKVRADILTALQRAVPREQGFAHNEGNSDAHAQSVLVGASQSFIIDHGKLVLGHWQAIYFIELDGPRSRQVLIKVLAG